MKTNAQTLLNQFEITATDLEGVKKYGEIVMPVISKYIDLFYLWLEKQPEYNEFFSDEEVLNQEKKSQIKYWDEFFQAQIDDDYVESRHQQGKTHAEIGLSLPAYLAASNKSFSIFTEELYDGSLTSEEFEKTTRAVNKLINFDMCIVVDSFTFLTNQIISEQNQALREMSTPVAEIWDDVLILPIVGIIDSKRSRDIMNTMLVKISDTEAKVIILDISGVNVVDTAVANHLIKITKATALMACECIISGISPAIAQTIVELGINVGSIRTTSNLKDALKKSFKAVGKKI